MPDSTSAGPASAGSVPLPRLRCPVVAAPMAGGPSTPALVAAVSDAGGLGFLAAGYLKPDALRAHIDAVRAQTRAPFGVNVFVPSPSPSAAETADESAAEVAAYAERLRPVADGLGVRLGEPRHDDDHWDAKLALLVDTPVPVVSFTFGCPPPEAVRALHVAGTCVLVTVTSPDEAVAAVDAGADGLVVQGPEAGAHRGSFTDADDDERLGLLPLLRLVARDVRLPLVATGGIADGAGVAAVLTAGAVAAQLGTVFLRCPEAGTSATHRDALARGGRPTVVTRAFSGRTARGLANTFARAHSDAAPAAYPQVHHLTSPLRAAARDAGDPESLHLWAGQAYGLGRDMPAAELVETLAREASDALDAARGRLQGGPT
ncbi:MAG: NAD(P)H-dependent flavin oxidoreductase [Actinomycetes bacterium]